MELMKWINKWRRMESTSGAPSSSTARQVQQLFSSFVGPLRAVKMKKRLLLVAPPCLALPSPKKRFFIWWMEWAAEKKRKTISSLLHWWAPQPIKKREIAFSSLIKSIPAEPGCLSLYELWVISCRSSFHSLSSNSSLHLIPVHYRPTSAAPGEEGNLSLSLFVFSLIQQSKLMKFVVFCLL